LAVLLAAALAVVVSSGPDIWTSRKKAKCCEQHLYSDLQALFDGVSKPNVFSSFCCRPANGTERQSKKQKQKRKRKKELSKKTCDNHNDK
jgi:hypothetical protein